MESKNILRVINNFKKVLPAASLGSLNMNEVRVSGNDCGTTHCHGGWYAVAVCDLTKSVTFSDGACMMAHTLGLGVGGKYESVVNLSRWAAINSDIWGNISGCYMFSSRTAFYHPTKRPYGAMNLQDIVDHWTEVYERVKAQESLIENKIS